MKDVLYIVAFIFPSTLTNLPVPAAEKQPHSMKLHRRTHIGLAMSGAWFPPDITLGVQDKEVNLVLSKTEQKKPLKILIKAALC